MKTALTKTEILAWLRETDSQRLEELWRRADETRREHVGDAVFLRGLVEVSNFCARQCFYCGLRAGNAKLVRYRMRAGEILEAAKQAVELGFGTVVLQGGEDYGLEAPWMADIIRKIKTETPLAVTLSLGERLDSDLQLWREAGADRYLLRFETSDAHLFDEIHPPLGNRPCDRIALLRRLKKLGYETGSGVMVGIPGQSYESLANDILLFCKLDLDMIGIGPFIPHPETPLGIGLPIFPQAKKCQVPNSELMVYKTVALTRLIRPDANIPATTALATINKANGRDLGLQRGANVFMPNLTPHKYRRLYEIYPSKACITEPNNQRANLADQMQAIGRHIGIGPGGRKNRGFLPSAKLEKEFSYA